MAPRKNAAAAAAAPPPYSTPQSNIQPSKVSSKSTTTPQTSTPRNAQDAQQILLGIYRNYTNHTAQRVKLLDAFMAFLVVVGVLQFVYCVLAGNYPFNAFLAGFSATVGQFVLTASLRIQTNPENKADFERISHERAFADFVFGSMILHFFCVNFIN
ncbi:defender against death DAD [Lecanosticta acicola]|uniref:Dolichyl-diphosphooligosaccharide--protein glycosyltransferase subunit OST2 n=1 Tax=Lecanosticta acicola TaxID=111012 RepID=A0AAI8Z3L8_9PEZI|nr:defender against death DAD [Lecanosticta acicola]